MNVCAQVKKEEEKNSMVLKSLRTIESMNKSRPSRKVIFQTTLQKLYVAHTHKRTLHGVYAAFRTDYDRLFVRNNF